jgi:hypothetical protein
MASALGVPAAVRWSTSVPIVVIMERADRRSVAGGFVGSSAAVAGLAVVRCAAVTAGWPTTARDWSWWGGADRIGGPAITGGWTATTISGSEPVMLCTALCSAGLMVDPRVTSETITVAALTAFLVRDEIRGAEGRLRFSVRVVRWTVLAGVIRRTELEDRRTEVPAVEVAWRTVGRLATRCTTGAVALLTACDARSAVRPTGSSSESAWAGPELSASPKIAAAAITSIRGSQARNTTKAALGVFTVGRHS